MADEGGGVQIRLSQEGGEEVIASLKAILSSLSELKTTAESTLGASMVTAGNQAIQIFEKLYSAMRGPIDEGIAFNAMVEQSTTKIAGLVSVYNTVPAGVDKYAVSVRVAAEAHELLIAAAVRTGSSIEGMAAGFEKLYGVARMSGAKSVEEVVNLETSVAVFARVMGTSVEAASSQVARAMQGMVNTRTEFGKFLTSLGIDKQTMLEWQAQGESVQKVSELLKEFNALAPAMRDTWVGVTTNMSNAWKQFVGTVTGPMFNELKTAMQGFVGGALNLDTGKLSGPLADYAKELGESLGGIVRAFAPLMESVVQLGLAVVKTFVEFVVLIKPVAPVLKDIIDLVTLLVNTFGSLGLGIGAAVGAFSMMSKAVSATGFLSFISTFINGLGGVGTAAVASADGLAHIAPAARTAFDSLFTLEKGANVAQVASLGTGTALAGITIVSAPLIIALAAVTGALATAGVAMFYFKEQAKALEATANVGETALLNISKIDVSKISEPDRIGLSQAAQAFTTAQHDYETLRKLAVDAATHPWKLDISQIVELGAALVKAKTNVGDLGIALDKLVVPAMKASHGVPAEDDQSQLTAAKKAEAAAKLFAAEETLAAAHAKTMESLATGGLLKELQAEEEYHSKVAKLRQAALILPQGPDDQLYKKNLAEQGEAYALFMNKKMLIEQEFTALVLKDSDAMISAHERAVRAGMSGTGSELQAIDDTKAAAQRTAYEAWSKADTEYANAKKDKLADMTIADREYAEAVRVYNDAVATSTLEAANKETAARQKISDALRTSISAYDVEILTAQGNTFEAALLTQNNKLLDDEIKFGIAWKDTVAKLQMPDVSGAYGPQLENPAIASLKKALSELATASAATAPVIVAHIKSIFAAMDAAGMLTPELARVREELLKMQAASSEVNAKTIRDNAETQAGMNKDWDVYWQKQERDIASGAITFNEGLKAMGDYQAKWATTAEEGFSAALLQIRGSMTSFGTDVATLFTGIWSSLTQSFDTGFYDILSGKFSDLGNVLKSLWDSILKDFSKMLEQMLMRWITTGDAMGNGQGTGGIFGSVFGGSASSGGSALSGGSRGPAGTPADPIYVSTSENRGVGTPGGTSTNSPSTGSLGGVTGWQEGGAGFVGPTQYGPGTYYSNGSYESGSGNGPGAGTGANLGEYAAIAYGAYTAYQGITAPHTTSTPTYQGQSLGQTADFGGQGGGATASAAVAVAAATAAVVALSIVAAAAEGVTLTVAAAASSVVPVVGWIVAAALLIVAVLLSVFSGPQEGHIKIALADAMSASGAATVLGTFVNQIVGQTADFIGSLALKAGDNVGQYMQLYQKAFKDAYGKATFDIAAGSPADLQKDVNAFFQTVLPTLAMKAAFGQTGYGFGGNRDAIGAENGGIAGTNWNANNAAIMDQQGNWVKQQLYDPKAPIPLMLDGLKFSAAKIGDIAGLLAGGEDIATFQKYLIGLIGVVVDFNDLVTQMSRTTAQWFSYLTTQKALVGTAGQFTPAITNIQNQGALLEGASAADQVTQAQALVTAGQQILSQEAQALSNILNFINQITTSTAAMVTSYQQKLAGLGENSTQQFHEMSVQTTADYHTMLDAANPAEVMAAWQTVQADFQTMLNGLFAEIQQVMQLQQSYAAFRTQMAADAGPQFTTDPTGWLAQNMTQIDTITTTLKTATGADAIKDAQTLLNLVQQRYSNEMAALQKVEAAIKSIDATSQASIQNLTMQAMGSVTTDPKTGAKSWTPDVHAQGEYLTQQYNSLMGELGKATTTDQINSIMGQINSVISQLAAQPQDPAHYAESRQHLIEMQQNAQDAADKLLGSIKDTITADLKDIGKLLKAGEASLDQTLHDDTWAYDQALKNLVIASNGATTALNAFADGLTTQMGQLVLDIQHWLFIMENTTGAVDPLWDYKKNQPNAPGVVTPGPEPPPPPPGGPQNPKGPLTPADEIAAAGTSALAFSAMLTDSKTGAVPAMASFIIAVNDATNALNGAVPGAS